jgi:PKD repeat protein
MTNAQIATVLLLIVLCIGCACPVSAIEQSVTIFAKIESSPSPEAVFIVRPHTGPAPLTVIFMDRSRYDPAEWAWDFTDDGIIDNRSRTTSYTYTTPGTYTVNLTVGNPYGTDWTTRTISVKGSRPPSGPSGGGGGGGGGSPGQGGEPPEPGKAPTLEPLMPESVPDDFHDRNTGTGTPEDAGTEMRDLSPSGDLWDILPSPVRDAIASLISVISAILSSDLWSSIITTLKKPGEYPGSAGLLAAPLPPPVRPVIAVVTGIGLAALGGLFGLFGASGDVAGSGTDILSGGSSSRIYKGGIIRSVLDAVRSGILRLPIVRNPAIQRAVVVPVQAIGSGVAYAFRQSFLSRFLRNILEFLRKWITFHIIGLIAKKESEIKNFVPRSGKSIFLEFSLMELVVGGITAFIYGIAFAVAGRLQIDLINLFFFLLMGASAVIGHEMVTDYFSRKNSCAAEFKFWGLGASILMLNASLFGMAFGKPSRTIVAGLQNLAPRNAAALMLIGPLVNIIFALLSLFLIPLGGILATAGCIGFSINILLSVYALVPVRPMKGRVIFEYHKGLWAIFFVPLILLYRFVYLLPCI